MWMYPSTLNNKTQQSRVLCTYIRVGTGTVRYLVGVYGLNEVNAIDTIKGVSLQILTMQLPTYLLGVKYKHENIKLKE